jgi:hypothetical protein
MYIKNLKESGKEYMSMSRRFITSAFALSRPFDSLRSVRGEYADPADRRFAVDAAVWALVAHIGPEPVGPGPAVARGQHWGRRIVAVQDGRGESPRLSPEEQPSLDKAPSRACCHLIQSRVAVRQRTPTKLTAVLS